MVFTMCNEKGTFINLEKQVALLCSTYLFPLCLNDHVFQRKSKKSRRTVRTRDRAGGQKGSGVLYLQVLYTVLWRGVRVIIQEECIRSVLEDRMSDRVMSMKLRG